MDRIEAIFATLAAGNAARRTGFGYAARCAVLGRLAEAIRRREAEILAALAADLGKPATEALLTEVFPVLSEIRHSRRHLRRWMRVRRVAPAAALFGTAARIRPEPKGTVLIMAPWNYPFALALGPLVSAIAAGNAAMVKPSEQAPATSALLARIVADLPGDPVAVVEGGIDVATALLALRFDHVFFTGSPAAGRVVMAAAARNLVPVTLELGGKSPAVLGPDADIGRAARMIAWGRFANAGQTCIAPDHVYVPRAQEAAFRAALRDRVARMYGPDPAFSASYARIAGPRHFVRLLRLIEDARARGADIEGAAAHADDRYIGPTVLGGTRPDMAVSRQEIFGPILPVIPYDTPDEVIARIDAGEPPLALYVFARDAGFIDRLTAETRSGAVGVNLVLAHFLHPGLPFGGIGGSGMGAAHGHWGFRTFSHERAVLRDRFSALGLLVPPYGAWQARIARALLRFFG